MATQQFTEQSKNYVVINPIDDVQIFLSGVALDAAGAPVDISAGYTLGLTIQNNPTAIAWNVGNGALANATFGADGSWSCKVAEGVRNNIPTGQRQFAMDLSDDAGVTRSICQKGTITMTRLNT